MGLVTALSNTLGRVNGALTVFPVLAVPAAVAAPAAVAVPSDSLAVPLAVLGILARSLAFFSGLTGDDLPLFTPPWVLLRHFPFLSVLQPSVSSLAVSLLDSRWLVVTVFFPLFFRESQPRSLDLPFLVGLLLL
eukprot:GHVT01030940.1.p2 GENE.GHVT01030940.1~~GHVT01030940.1.p2  ORF type:complete len:134 (-),score=11.69 GHVT01030940.1:520-921(-)